MSGARRGFCTLLTLAIARLFFEPLITARKLRESQLNLVAFNRIFIESFHTRRADVLLGPVKEQETLRESRSLSNRVL